MIVIASAPSAKPRHGTLAAVEDGHEAIIMLMTWSAEFFLDGARVANKDDVIAVQSIKCADLIITRAANVCRKPHTAAMGPCESRSRPRHRPRCAETLST